MSCLGKAVLCIFLILINKHLHLKALSCTNIDLVKEIEGRYNSNKLEKKGDKGNTEMHP